MPGLDASSAATHLGERAREQAQDLLNDALAILGRANLQHNLLEEIARSVVARNS